MLHVVGRTTTWLPLLPVIFLACFGAADARAQDAICSEEDFLRTASPALCDLMECDCELGGEGEVVGDPPRPKNGLVSGGRPGDQPDQPGEGGGPGRGESGYTPSPACVPDLRRLTLSVGIAIKSDRTRFLGRDVDYEFWDETNAVVRIPAVFVPESAGAEYAEYVIGLAFQLIAEEQRTCPEFRVVIDVFSGVGNSDPKSIKSAVDCPPNEKCRRFS